MSDLEQRIANLPAEKRALLEQRLQDMASATEKSDAIPKRQSQEPVPLSSAQERLWFLAQLYPDQTTYNEASAYRFRGQLDVQALQAALTAIIHRHEILRTTYHGRESGPVQIVGQPQEVPLPLADLTETPASERKLKAEKHFTEVIEVPFDLESDLMLRCCLYRLGHDDHILLTVRHHIASDGWSSRLFWNELAQLYTANVSDRASNLPELSIQYADYALWQRERLQGRQLERGLDYWRKQLDDHRMLNLPTDRRRPETLSYRGAGERFVLDQSVVEKLQSLAVQDGTTLHTLFTAAYVVLLARLTGQDDIAVGVPVAGRIRLELEPLIGFFVNTLVIRATLDDNVSFRALLRQIRQTMLEALDHQDIPFEKLVETVQPERHLNWNPLVSVAFQFRELIQKSRDFPKLRAEGVDVPILHAKFDMECSLVANTEGVSGTWRYAVDLFDEVTIKRFIGHYQTLLAAIVDDPDCAIGRLPMLTRAERRQLLVAWNDTAVTYPRNSTIHALFESQAQSAPQSTAVSFGGDSLSYAELNQRANQLARHLIHQGVHRGELVGLMIERSLELVVSVLAILKTGAGYLPLDRKNPQKRIKWMLDVAECRTVIGEQGFTRLLLGDQRRWIPLDDEEEAALISGQSTDNLDQSDEVSATSVAYVMFTSGSTGQPKGVMVPHRGVVRLVKNTNYADLGSGQRMLLLSPIGFDASTLEIWGPLLNGGQLFIYPPGPIGLRELSAYLQETRITTLFLTAGLFHQMVDHDVKTLATIPHILSGGDVVSAQHVRRLLQSEGICTFSNAYGPAENTTFATFFPLSRENDIGDSLPIGRPISNSTVYILDANLQPVPIGVTGELYIGGDGLALGYLNEPELTKQAFIPNPFSSDSESRLYRTGDQARYLPDGNIEFLGRLDWQVKIRGYRVEPGEIESILTQHPGVREATVMALDHEWGNKYLAAYFVPATPHDIPSTVNLRDFLAKKVPEYMLPAHFVVIDHLPLTSNGKIDRAALPLPDSNTRPTKVPLVAPRTPEEEAIAAVWCEVLQLEQVSVHDNFFELGGHSLLATQVAARITDFFEVDFPLRLLFEKPTVAKIATEVKELVAGEDDRRQKLASALARLDRLSPEERAALLKARGTSSQPDSDYES